MNHHPVISIVTIFRDPPVPFFEEAIASVFAQTESRWELLLVDDGSTKPGAAMADSIARDNPDRVSVLRHPGGVNRGMSASRNLGISAAQGEFVSFLDADDLYLPEKLERQLAEFSRHAEVAMVYGPSLYWWGWTGDSKDAGRDHPRRLGLRPNEVVAAPLLARAWLADRGDTPATCAVLIRRQAIEAVGRFETDFVDLYEDQVLFYKLALAYPAYLEGQAWDRYRRHPAALCEVRIREGTHSDDTRPTPARERFLVWLEAYLTATGIRDEAVWRGLRRQQWPFRHPLAYRVATTTGAVTTRAMDRARILAGRLVRRPQGYV